MRLRMFESLCLTCLWSCGCGANGPQVQPVSGDVVFQDGVALQGGLIEFSTVEPPMTAQGKIGPDGKFRLTTVREGDGAVAGEHRVIVLPLAFNDLEHHKHDKQNLRRPAKKHASYETSGLKFQVRAGETNHFKVVIDRAP